ncbi:Putative 2-hydroxyacyl-CoA lyase [Wickerhamiella sorbophila]|uniref:2-hydroxyacyl-CoA lyase n=1 Tax=Wickerhamiella sorbophila TaxID=45607 RepID=A0A2T0FDY1_9ASCO|nr:Putative 2-hydroxyacyl-CoA lyase [Wickerhamiella sorbophila]PRT53191.1 Putative 2-hydroxyacyl-CoA lyase [Wickerhamiella sorbophila]
MTSGAEIVANSLKELGVEHIFGIVGIPVIEVAEACIAKGINFISFRNEQTATYAASIYGYLTGKPGVTLVVGGPGVVHALAGVENARVNRSPLLVLAGSSETHQRGMGAFQQLDQVALMRSHTKFAEQPATPSDVPRLIEQAYRYSYFGKAGATYVDLPADIIQGSGTITSPLKVAGPPPRSIADPHRIAKAAALLKSAKFPLLIVGKGAAYARAETSIRAVQSQTNVAFLPTPMGKGVVPDSVSTNMSACRSGALKQADVILVLGARLNWILHYGQAPKFAKDVQIIQVDNDADVLGDNGGSADLGILGDVDLVATQLLQALKGWKAPNIPEALASTREKNEKKAAAKEQQPANQLLKYEPVYKVIRNRLANVKAPIVFVSEGANTMDISRSSFPLDSPRSRLDAGTNATMGVGLGYAIAAKTANPESIVVAIEGDSAFGFSGLEIETAVRHKLPMIIYVMNNSGVYHGVDPGLYKTNKPLPSTALSLDVAYHKLAESLGAKGFLAKTLQEVDQATKEALSNDSVNLINVIIDPAKDKKLEFGWMASTKPAKL